MGYSGRGEWHKWNDSSFFGTKFVWTALMNFGGTNGVIILARLTSYVIFCRNYRAVKRSKALTKLWCQDLTNPRASKTALPSYDEYWRTDLKGQSPSSAIGA